MKQLLSRLKKFFIEEKPDFLFMMRMKSIEKQIDQAVECVSFDILRYAMWRVEHENEFEQNEMESKILTNIVEQIGEAREQIKQILIKESLCSN